MIGIDNRAGSFNLISKLPKSLVQPGRYDGDVEFLGNGPDDSFVGIGIEYKTIPDCLSSMTEGRLTGVQIPRMQETYQRIYLLVEGMTRVGPNGVLEYALSSGRWVTAHGRRGEGWSAREFFNRINSLEEFPGVRVHRTSTIQESAEWILALYHWWQKPYADHASYKAWDQRHATTTQRAASLLIPTSDRPLVERWARELDGVGQHRAPAIARHFKEAVWMVLADESEWGKIAFDEKMKTKKGYRQRHMSKETIRKIRREIWGAGLVESESPKGRGAKKK